MVCLQSRTSPTQPVVLLTDKCFGWMGIRVRPQFFREAYGLGYPARTGNGICCYSTLIQINSNKKRRKTRRAFLFSLVLHAIATGIIGLGYIRWYQPMQPSEPLTSEAISVASLQRFHVNSTRKRSMPVRRSTPARSKTSPAVNQNIAKLMHSAPPTASSASIPVLKTDARVTDG